MPDLSIYSDDALNSPWHELGGATVLYDSTDYIHAGTTSMMVTLVAWGSFNPANGNWGSFTELDPADYDSVDFWIYLTATEALRVRVGSYGQGGGTYGSQNINPTPGQWVHISVPMSTLSPNGDVFDWISIDERSGNTPTFYVDDMSIIAAAATDISASLSETLEDVSISSAAAVEVSGQTELTAEDAQISATAALPIEAQSSVTSDVEIVSTVNLPIGAQVGETLNDASVESTATLPIEAESSVNSDATIVSTAAIPIGAEFSETLEDTAIDARAATEDVLSASLDEMLEDAAVSATSVLPISGSAVVDTSDTEVAAIASVLLSGSLSELLEDAIVLATARGNEIVPVIFLTVEARQTEFTLQARKTSYDVPVRQTEFEVCA